MAKEKAATPFDFAGLMASMGGPRSYTNQALYGLFPKTAAAYAGVPVAGRGAITLSQSALTKGAMGVARMGTRRFITPLPLAQGILQTLGGDPIGGVGTAGGGFAGAALGAKLGMPFGPAGVIAGGLIGGGIGGGLGQSASRGLAGIDVNNPLTGPDFSILGIPLTPYAKTKKSVERAAELEALRMKELLPMMEKARQQQFQRDLVGAQVQMAGQLMGNIYPR